jgi:hypothetical protein
VSVKKDARESFRKVVRNVNGRVDSFQADKITLHPVTESEVFNIDMACAGCGFMCIAHSRTAVIVFIGNGGSFLRDVQVPQDAAHKELHSTRRHMLP